MTSVVDPSGGQGPAVEHADQGNTGHPGHAGHPHDHPPAGPPQFVAAPSSRLTRWFTALCARSPRWAAPLAALICVAGAIGYTLWSNPTDSAPDAAPTCLLKLTTGLDCPGCGGTRAAWYLLHGDLGAAARHHIVFVFAVPFLIYFFVAWSVQTAFGKKLPQLRVGPTTVGVFFAAWLVFSVVRNLPWAPFTWFYV